VRDDAIDAEAALFVFLVSGEIALEPFDMAVAFEGQNMGRDAIQEEAVMRDDHGATRERVLMDQMIAFDRDAR
jgi:hypothetical protein